MQKVITSCLFFTILLIIISKELFKSMEIRIWHFVALYVDQPSRILTNHFKLMIIFVFLELLQNLTRTSEEKRSDGTKGILAEKCYLKN